MQLDDTADSPASDFFEEWRTYRKMVDNNYLFHREAYASLRRFLVAEVGRRFLFLDIACGDSTAAVDALKDTQVVAYHGVDFSRHALQLAAPAVAALDCRIALEHGDYVDILRNRTEPTDVAWIGLSLHHLQAAAKQSVMRDIRRIVGDAGALLSTKTPVQTVKTAKAGCAVGTNSARPGQPTRPRSGAWRANTSTPSIFRRQLRAGTNSAGHPGSTGFASSSGRRRTSSACTLFRHRGLRASPMNGRTF